MAKRELTLKEKEFKLDDLTLNNDFIYWLTKAKCMWNLKETNRQYNELRKELDHATAMETLKRKMFVEGIK